MSDIETQLAELRAEVAQLREWIMTGGPRFGPRRDTPEEAKEKASELAGKLIEAVKAAKVEPPPVDRNALCTTNGKPVAEVRASQTNETGMHDGYIVLCDDERAKGFVRPFRDAYKHLSCGSVTTMGRKLSETYARDPGFYGATFCVSCNKHLPVAEFVWTLDGQPVGS